MSEDKCDQHNWEYEGRYLYTGQNPNIIEDKYFCKRCLEVKYKRADKWRRKLYDN